MLEKLGSYSKQMDYNAVDINKYYLLKETNDIYKG